MTESEIALEQKRCDYLEQLRWNGSPTCPHCNTHKKPYVVSARGKNKGIQNYRCSNQKRCDSTFNVLTHTIFSGSNIPISKYLILINQLRANPDTSLYEISGALNITVKTAFCLKGKISFGDPFINSINPDFLPEFKVDKEKESYVRERVNAYQSKYRKQITDKYVRQQILKRSDRNLKDISDTEIQFKRIEILNHRIKLKVNKINNGKEN